MKPDLYTKVVLTIIAVTLCVIAAKPFTQPQPVSAQSQLFGFAVGPNGNFYLYSNGRISVKGPDGSRKGEISLGY